MNYIQEKRRKLIGLLIFLLTSVVVFMTLIGYGSEEISRKVNESQEYKKESIEQFLSLSINIQYNFIDIIEEDWERYNNNDIEGFIEYSLMSIPNSAIDSIVIAYVKNDEVYSGYFMDKYGDLEKIKNKINTDTHKKIQIVNGSHDIAFGEGERFYYTSAKLDEDFVVVVGFLEQVMYNQFISSLNIDAVSDIDKSAQRVLYYTYLLMLFIFIFGVYLFYEIRKINVNFSCEILCEEGKTNENIEKCPQDDERGRCERGSDIFEQIWS